MRLLTSKSIFFHTQSRAKFLAKMAKDLPPSTVATMGEEPEVSPWIGKSKAWKLFNDIDEYVTSYVSDHQEAS